MPVRDFLAVMAALASIVNTAIKLFGILVDYGTGRKPDDKEKH
jgi:hypothetical protein